MKRIIDIPEEEIKRICENGVVEHIYLVADAIKDSIPLSECRTEDCISREDTYNTMRLMMDNATIGDSDDGGVYESLEAIKEQYLEIVKGMASVYPEPEIIDWNNCHTPEQLESISTTKNDLGVDCVDRQDVERYIEGFINEYTPKEELEFINLELDGLKHLPSVIPQEPRKGYWIDTNDKGFEYHRLYKCSNCEYTICAYPEEIKRYKFCYGCGSRNEVEE